MRAVLWPARRVARERWRGPIFLTKFPGELCPPGASSPSASASDVASAADVAFSSEVRAVRGALLPCAALPLRSFSSSSCLPVFSPPRNRRPRCVGRAVGVRGGAALAPGVLPSWRLAGAASLLAARCCSSLLRPRRRSFCCCRGAGAGTAEAAPLASASGAPRGMASSAPRGMASSKPRGMASSARLRFVGAADVMMSYSRGAGGRGVHVAVRACGFVACVVV